MHTLSYVWTEIVRTGLTGGRAANSVRLKGLNLLLYKDEIVWRFKKVDGAGRHRNYQSSKQQRDSDNQFTLPGIPSEAVRLTSGYQPDEAGQSIDRIIVRARLESRWFLGGADQCS